VTNDSTSASERRAPIADRRSPIADRRSPIADLFNAGLKARKAAILNSIY
jgi:hypothetical protein